MFSFVWTGLFIFFFKHVMNSSWNPLFSLITIIKVILMSKGYFYLKVYLKTLIYINTMLLHAFTVNKRVLVRLRWLPSVIFHSPNIFSCPPLLDMQRQVTQRSAALPVSRFQNTSITCTIQWDFVTIYVPFAPHYIWK